MKTIRNLVLGLSLIGLAGTSLAAGSVQHSAAASGHSVAAIGHATLASGKVVAAVVSVPLQAAGVVGRASGDTGAALSDWADSDGPLPVAEQALIADPAPNRMLSDTEE